MSGKITRIALWVLFFSFIAVGTAAAQTISLNVQDQPTGSATARIFNIILMITVLSIAPSILVMMTSFTRIIVVFSITRSALATNSTPPNMVLISLALQSFFAKNKSETVELTLKALKSVSIGLIASAASVIVLLSWFAVSSWRQISGGPDLRAVGISLAALLLLRKFHMNPVWVMCVCGAAGFFLY